ncbi:hypothetical protein CEY11_12850 [Candidimonas nitroreducens]|uniref:Uncharacterized protein n=1 Tax=Candidimonas nitroreducens TaxID=683354 RepID=A0A225MCP5_9BURK|nr:hypothetical protein CEY11_12850 [Candidimonas nitroreducens]
MKRSLSCESCPPSTPGEIAHGKRATSADTDPRPRPRRYLGLSHGYWLRGQARYDTGRAQSAMAGVPARIRRCDATAA